MSIAKIASEARALAKSILASLPFSMRVARALAYVSKVAYQEDVLGYGIAVLEAFRKAGIEGSVGRTGVLVSEKNRTKQRKAALELAKRILGASGVGKRFSKESIQEGLWASQEQLLRGNVDLKSSYNIDQAVSYVSKNLRNHVLNHSRTQDNQQGLLRERGAPTYEDLLMGNPGSFSKVPLDAWKKFIDRVERNPRYEDANGVNRMTLWLEQVAFEGDAVSSLARSLGISEAAFRKWINEHRQYLKKDFQQVLKYMDEVA